MNILTKFLLTKAIIIYRLKPVLINFKIAIILVKTVFKVKTQTEIF